MTPIGVLMLMAIGATPTSVGRGFLTRTSVGQPITMAVGRGSLITAGCGSPAATSNGVRRGFPGEPVATTLAGHRFLRVAPELFTKGSPLASRWTSNLISAL